MNTFKTLLYSVTIIVSIASCSVGDLSDDEITILRDRFYNPAYVMSDTIIEYELYTDSLVLKFKPEAHYNYWYTEGSITDTSRNRSIMLWNEEDKPVVNNTMIFKGFHIPEDSLSFYKPKLFAFPAINDGSLVLRKPISNNRIIFRKQSSSNILTPWGPSATQNYVQFHIESFDTLSKKEIEYCFSVIHEELGMDSSRIRKFIEEK